MCKVKVPGAGIRWAKFTTIATVLFLASDSDKTASRKKEELRGFGLHYLKHKIGPVNELKEVLRDAVESISDVSNNKLLRKIELAVIDTIGVFDLKQDEK